MKNLAIVLLSAALCLPMASGIASNTPDPEADPNPSPKMESGGCAPGGMGMMHHQGAMHHGMQSHHMMQSDISPVTVVVYPGGSPMMQPRMMHHGMKGMRQPGTMNQKRMTQQHNMGKEHMEQMEQRLANIEKLLGELVEELRD